MPNMPEVTVGGVTYKLKDSDLRKDIVKVSDTQPTEENNRIWIQEENHEIQVPTYEEFSNLKSALKFISDGQQSIDISDYDYISCVISANNTTTRSASKYMSRQIPREEHWNAIRITANSEQAANVTFVKEAIEQTPTSGGDMSAKLATGETGRHVIDIGTTETLSIPDDAAYIIIAYRTNNNDVIPTDVAVLSNVQTKLNGKQDTLVFDIVPTEESNNPITSGGVFDAVEIIADKMTYAYSNFVQKNINATSGDLTNTGAENVITNDALIPTESLYHITSYNTNIRLYKYDDLGNYLGNQKMSTNSLNAGDIKTFIENNPTATRLRVRFGDDSYPVSLDVESEYYYASKGVALMLFSKSADDGIVTFERIARYGTDGVFTPSGSEELRFTIAIPFNGDYRNQIYTCVAKYVQASGITLVPTVCFYVGGSTTNLKRTTAYELGGKNNFTTKQWRLMRYPGDTTTYYAVFTIPVGVTVTIKDFYNVYSNEINRTTGIRINNHVRYAMTPDFTMPSVEMAIKSGACALIQIPKRLSDGVWIFYHDDSLIYNDTIIRQTDGSELPSTYNGTLWSAIDSATAFSWDWGISFDSRFAGLKPMTMEEFFTACGKTGVMPMLSIHPWPSISELLEIKTIARKCGVLNMLGIKCTVSHIAEAYAAFGNDIESYTIDVSSGSQTASVINAVISAMDGLTGCTVRRVIELFASTAYDAYFGSSTYNAFDLISAAGYGCAIAQQKGAFHPTAPNSNDVLIKPTDFDYWQDKGVTEYTYEYNWSNGLNW